MLAKTNPYIASAAETVYRVTEEDRVRIMLEAAEDFERTQRSIELLHQREQQQLLQERQQLQQEQQQLQQEQQQLLQEQQKMQQQMQEKDEENARLRAELEALKRQNR